MVIHDTRQTTRIEILNSTEETQEVREVKWEEVISSQVIAELLLVAVCFTGFEDVISNYFQIGK